MKSKRHSLRPAIALLVTLCLVVAPGALATVQLDDYGFSIAPYYTTAAEVAYALDENRRNAEPVFVARLAAPGLLDSLREHLSLRVMSYQVEARHASASGIMETLVTLEIPVGEQVVRAWRRGETASLDERGYTTLMTARDVLASILSDRMTELEKEIAIHDYLAGNVRYERTGDVADAYSALLLGVAKCTGYSDAFYLLASMAGLEVAKMPGYADDERHEWNAIRLGGLWYFVDVTWDAPDPRAVGRYSRAYLNLPPAMMRDTHSWDSRNEPGALATVLDTNNYYASRGLVAQDADALIGVAVDSLRVGQPLSLLYPAGLSVDTVAQAAVEAVAQVSGAGSYRAAYRSQPMGGWQYVEMTLLRE